MTLDEMNRTIKTALALLNNKALNEEVEHFLYIDDDEQRPRDYYDALCQAEQLAEYNNERKVLTPARTILISLGVYVVVTEEQLANTMTLGGGKKYAFQLGGLKYNFEKHLKEL
jgi:hypothetical protein